MTAVVVARLDAELVQELLDLREDYPHEVEVLGIATVALVAAVSREVSRAAEAVAQQLEDDPLSLLDFVALDSFGDAYPALDQWRRSVLDRKGRRDPLEAAAAWEVTAVECERSGDMASAKLAREAALQALVPRSRRRSA